MVSIAIIESALRDVGLVSRGGFHPRPEDQVPPMPDGADAGTVILAGNVGDAMWRHFQQARAGLTRENPLNNWTRQILDAIATHYGAQTILPFDGPPYHPFQRWAQRAEPVVPSPIGTLIHPDFGLWHAYRGALAFAEHIALPPFAARPSPCETCHDKPCLAACPVHAFASGRYDVDACLDYVGSEHGAECLHRGCLARRACPVGQQFKYSTGQARFHMEAFLRNARS